MAKNYPPYASHFDANQVPSSMGVIGTLGTADTGGTAQPLPFSVDPLTGAQYVHSMDSLVSSANSTTTPLGSAGTYTGTGEQNMYNQVLVYSIADQAGTLYMQWSNDGTTYYDFPTAGIPVSANIPKYYPAVKGGRYYRSKMINGTVAQNSLNLTTYYGNNFVPSVSPLNQAVNLTDPALIVRNVDNWLDISRGLQNGHSVVKKFGANLAVGTSYTVVSTGGIYNTPTSAVSLEFVSSSSADALNGAGMHEITVEGLDANWNLQTVTVSAHATDGTTPVALTGTWLRVFRAYVSKSGTYGTATAGSHVGTITIRVAGAGATWTQIILDNGFPLAQTLIGAYTVPIGYTGYIFLTSLSVDSGKTVDLAFFTRENANDTTSSYSGGVRVKSMTRGFSGGVGFNRTGDLVPFKVVGPADVGFLAAGASTPEVAVEFEIHLVQE